MELIDRQHQLEDEIHQTMSKDPNCEWNGVNGCDATCIFGDSSIRHFVLSFAFNELVKPGT